MVLEDTTKTVIDENSGSIKADVVTDAEHLKPVTPSTSLWRSDRIQRSPQRFSPLAYFLLLIEDGEPHYYSEAVKLDDSV